MKKVRQFFKHAYSSFIVLTDIHWFLWLLFFVSIYAMLVVDLEWEQGKIPELWMGAYKAEKSLYQIAVGYLVSFIFYYVVVFLPTEAKSKVVFKRQLDHSLKAFYNEISDILLAVKHNTRNKSNIPVEDFFKIPTNKKIEEIFKLSKPSDDAYFGNQRFGNMEISERIKNLFRFYQNTFSNITLRGKVGDYRLEEILLNIEYGPGLFFFYKNPHIDIEVEPDLGFIGMSFVILIEQVRNLSSYCKKKIWFNYL